MPVPQSRPAAAAVSALSLPPVGRGGCARHSGPAAYMARPYGSSAAPAPGSSPGRPAIPPESSTEPHHAAYIAPRPGAAGRADKEGSNNTMVDTMARELYRIAVT